MERRDRAFLMVSREATVHLPSTEYTGADAPGFERCKGSRALQSR
jgi:hypothetical protein